MAFLYFIAGTAALCLIVWILGEHGKAKKYEQLKPKFAELESRDTQLTQDKLAFDNLVKEQCSGFPSLAKAYADYLYLQDLKRADYLTYKKHPALTAAQHLREVADQRRIAEELSRTLKSKVELYESILPHDGLIKLADSLTNFKEADFDNLLTRIKRAADGEAIEILAKEKCEGFPWLAQAYADYLHLQDMERARVLESKSPPAPIAAEQVREIAAQRRLAEKLERVLKYQLEYYETLFPWLVDFKGEDLDDLIRQVTEKREQGDEIEEPDDAAKKWLTEAEYRSLPTAEKCQLALDRYWQKKKSKWEVGRDYERYVGYRYESEGYGVYYQGIVEGLADLGRDLIATKGNSVEVIQCKCWSQEKQIHEKHVLQLYGTVVAYKIDNPEKQVSAVLVTSTKLSDKAKHFAKMLRVRTLEDHPLGRYPSIKCNVSRRGGAKIYHLPFDQQYDRTIIEEERNERYVETVAEAESLGFRRAFRWHGTS